MVGDSLGDRDHAEVACGVLGYGGCGVVDVVSDCLHGNQGVIDRLMKKVEFDPFGGCWLWSGANDHHGYGKMRVFGKLKSVHRLSYRLHHGSIENEKHIRHRCDVRACVNPAHLVEGTRSENMQDCVARNRFVPICDRERVSSAKLNVVIRLRGASIGAIADVVMLSEATVRKILRKEGYL